MTDSTPRKETSRRFGLKALAEPSKQESMMEQIDFAVIGDEKIHCSGCETRIRFALKRMEGVRHVDADAKTQRVAVAFDPIPLTANQIHERLAEMGFEVEVSS